MAQFCSWYFSIVVEVFAIKAYECPRCLEWSCHESDPEASTVNVAMIPNYWCYLRVCTGHSSPIIAQILVNTIPLSLDTQASPFAPLVRHPLLGNLGKMLAKFPSRPLRSLLRYLQVQAVTPFVWPSVLSYPFNILVRLILLSCCLFTSLFVHPPLNISFLISSSWFSHLSSN